MSSRFAPRRVPSRRPPHATRALGRFALALACGASGAGAALAAGNVAEALAAQQRATEAYKDAYQAYSQWYVKAVLEQTEGPNFRLVPAWGPELPLGAVYDVKNKADPNLSCELANERARRRAIVGTPATTDVLAVSGDFSVPILSWFLEKLGAKGNYKRTLTFEITDASLLLVNFDAFEQHTRTQADCKRELNTGEGDVQLVRGVVYGREKFETKVETSASLNLGTEAVGLGKLSLDPSSRKASVTDTAERPKFYVLTTIVRGTRGSTLAESMVAPSDEEVRLFVEAQLRRAAAQAPRPR